MDYGFLLHYGTIGCTVACTSLGAGIGEGIIGVAALEALDRQPYAHNELRRLLFVTTALIETTAVLGLFAALMLMNNVPATITFYSALAEVGIGVALCIAGFIIGVVSGFPAREALIAVARHPAMGQKILGFTIITQALAQTPIIAAFVVALFIKNSASFAAALPESLRLLAAGLCVGIGSIGPALGLAYFTQRATHAVGINKDAYERMLSFSLISQTLIETPLIFALIVSLLFFFMLPPLGEHDHLIGIATLAAALATGLGTIGVGISSGVVAGSVCTPLTQNPSNNVLMRASMFAQALIETCVVYAVLVSLAILFLCSNM